MRVAVYERYGPPEVVTITERPEPAANAGEFRIRVHAAAIGSSDSAGRSGTPWFARLAFGLRAPKRAVLGSDFAGVVDAVGPGVTRFAVGDRVYGATGIDAGAHAEGVVVSESGAIVRLPDEVGMADAAAICDGALTALPFLRDGARVGHGTRVLVNGASGSVGAAGVQLAKHLGAEVTATCGPAHVELVRALGADRVIDYTRQDFTLARSAFDVIFDAIGKSTFRRCRARAGAGRHLPHDRAVLRDPVPAADLADRRQACRDHVHGPPQGRREDPRSRVPGSAHGVGRPAPTHRAGRAAGADRGGPSDRRLRAQGRERHRDDGAGRASRRAVGTRGIRPHDGAGIMRAIVQHRYGGPEMLALAEVEAPVPADDEVLIRVRAVAVSAGDALVMRGEPRAVRLAFGLRRPKQSIIGRDVAGEVAAIGPRVTRFHVGDPVYAESDQGGYAEFVAVQERFVAPRPTTVDAIHAAAVPVSGTTALQGLRLADVGPGTHVLVNGASGGVGGFAVQLAKAMGAEVTGVCRATKADHVRAIGADHVIDYTSEDFTAGGIRYDVIFDLVADHPLGHMRRALSPKGTLVLSSGKGGRVFGPFGRIIRASVISPFVSQRLRPLAARRNGDDLAELTRRIEAGEVTPVVDRTYDLADAAEAIRQFESGAVRGKVVLTV